MASCHFVSQQTEEEEEEEPEEEEEEKVFKKKSQSKEEKRRIQCREAAKAYRKRIKQNPQLYADYLEKEKRRNIDRKEKGVLLSARENRDRKKKNRDYMRQYRLRKTLALDHRKILVLDHLQDQDEDPLGDCNNLTIKVEHNLESNQVDTVKRAIRTKDGNVIKIIKME